MTKTEVVAIICKLNSFVPSKEGKASERLWPGARAEASQIRWSRSVLLFPMVTLGLHSMGQRTLFGFLNLFHIALLQGPDSWISFYICLRCHLF